MERRRSQDVPANTMTDDERVQRTERRALMHKAHIEYDVYEEHDAISNAVTNRLMSTKEEVSDMDKGKRNARVS